MQLLPPIPPTRPTRLARFTRFAGSVRFVGSSGAPSAWLRAAVLTAAVLPVPAFAAGLNLLSLWTLVGEIITFAILVWVVMKYVWPPLMNAVEERRKEIAEGLAAGEQGRKDLDAAEKRKDELMADANASASKRLEDSRKRGEEIVAEARREAEAEKARIVESGHQEVEAERTAMRRELQGRVGALAVAGAEKILGREVDAAAHAGMVDALKKEL